MARKKVAEAVLEDNLSLFENAPNPGKASASEKLDVVKLEYVQAEALTWQDLFNGYNTLKAITFSSGIAFLYRLLDLFEDAEVVFGCEGVISPSVQELMAHQNNLLEKLREKASSCREAIVSRLENGSVRFYVSREKVSHEKLYLLSSNDGRKRVILGSANLSYNAFGGVQRENICYIDGDAAYDWHLGVYQALLEDSSDRITHTAYETADLSGNIDALPISETIRVKKAIVLEPVKDAGDDVEFVLTVQKNGKARQSFR